MKYTYLYLLLALFALASCDQKSSGDSLTKPGAEVKNKVPYSSREIRTIQIAANTSEWVTVSGVETAGGSITEIIFDTDNSVFIRGIKGGSISIFEYNPSANTYSGDPSLPFSYGPFFKGVALYDNAAPGAVLPMVFNASAYYPSGDYQFLIENPNTIPSTVKIYEAKKTDPDFAQGKLDINLFVYASGSSGSSALPGIGDLPLPPLPMAALSSGQGNEVIPDETEAQNIKRYMNEMFAQVGVSIENMNVYFVDDPNAYSIASAADLVTFLQNASSGTAGRTDVGINCFLLPSLPNSILGMDGAIPGPAFVHGTKSSGIIAQVAPYGVSASGMSSHETDQRLLAKILAHEIGHYLGLYHTTESTGTDHDPLSDTPECPSSMDSDGDGKVSGPECRSNGADYLMFWVMDGGLIKSGNFQTVLSPMEGEAINTHPSIL